MKRVRTPLTFAFVVSLALLLTSCGLLFGGTDDSTDDNTPPTPPDPTPTVCVEHSWDLGQVWREPTCTWEGERLFRCSVCDEVKYEPIPKIDHTYDYENWSHDANYHWHGILCHCFSGATIDKEEHTWDEGRVLYEPNCFQYGTYLYSCTVCGGQMTETLPRTEHIFAEEWTYGANYHWHESICECGGTRSELIPHTWDEGTVTTPPTCKDKGILTYSCTVCDAKNEESIPITDVHVWDGGTVTEPTCTEEGFTTYTCTTCTKTYTDLKTDKLPHSYVTTVIEPTCEEEGYTKHTCSECGKFYTDTFVSTIPHVYDKVISFDPTCITPGFISTYCSGCGEKNSEVTLAKSPHPYVSTVIPPTCDREGYTKHVCSYCDDWYIDSYTETIEHDYGIEITEPTCTRGSYKVFTCNSCGYIVTEALTAPLPHDYVATVTPPTCQRGGDTTHVCSVCSDRYVDSYTHKVDHSYADLLCIWCSLKEYSFDLNFTLSADGSYYTVSGMGECTDTNVIIPHTHEGIPVREIDESAFKGNTKITSVTFLKGGETEQTVGAYAFSGCTALTSIHFGVGVISIGNQVLTNCPALESITVEAENTAYRADGNCLIDIAKETVISGCKTSVIPDDSNVTRIGDYAFYECTTLTEITIPYNVVIIGTYAFTNSGLQNVYFKATMNWCYTRIESEAINRTGGSSYSQSLIADSDWMASRLIMDYKNYWFVKIIPQD